MQRRGFIKAALGVLLGLVCPLEIEAKEKKLKQIWRRTPTGFTRVRMIAIRKGDRFISISENEPGQTWIAYSDGHYRHDGEPMVEVITCPPDQWDKSFLSDWVYYNRRMLTT